MDDSTTRPLVGRTVVAIGVVHLAAAPWVVGAGVRGIIEAGVVGAVEPADPAERERRSHAFWYVMAGLGVLAGGAATSRLERGEAGLPRATGPVLLALTAWGGALMPASGFWAFAIPGVLALRRSRRDGGPDRAHRVPVADPVALARRHDYADAFELRLEEPDRCSPEQWVRAGIDATPPWVKRVAGHPDGLGTARIVESGPEVVVLEDSDPLMDTVMIGRNVDSRRRVLTTVLRHRRPLAARTVWGVIGFLHRRTARQVVAGGLP